METPTSQGIRLSLVPLRIHARTGSSGLSAPFCPLAFLLSPDQSEGWLVGAVGIEPIAQIQALTITLFSSAIFDSRLKAAADHSMTLVQARSSKRTYLEDSLLRTAPQTTRFGD